MLAETAEFRRGRIRREDYSLSDEQQLLRDTYRRMLTTHSPSERVRAVEGSADRFDHRLWSKMVEIGANSLAVPLAIGGAGAGLIEAALIAEELGRVGAATPFVETTTISRLLPSIDDERREPLTSALVDGRPIVALALHDTAVRARQLVGCGSVADSVIALVGGSLVRARGTRLDTPANIASAPLAWWQVDPAEGEVLIHGPAASAAHAAMVREWKLLTAASVIGLAETALRDAVTYAKERHAFGVPIGAFQAVSHPLADVATALQAARRLVWRAAWFADHEPDAAPELLPMAVVYASEVATKAVTVGVHVQGGFGVTNDSDMQLYFRRAKGWPLLAGDPHAELEAVAGIIRARGARPTDVAPAARALEVST